jgi:hypothetical protein
MSDIKRLCVWKLCSDKTFNYKQVSKKWHAVSSSKVKKIELWMSNMNALLPTAIETRQRIMSFKCFRIVWFLPTDWQEHPGNPSVHLSWGAYLKNKMRVPCGLAAPSSAIWLKDVRWVHGSLPSSVCVTTNDESLCHGFVSCDRVASCVTHCFRVQSQVGFFF